jgi:hypothetical protein
VTVQAMHAMGIASTKSSSSCRLSGGMDLILAAAAMRFDNASTPKH